MVEISNLTPVRVVGTISGTTVASGVPTSSFSLASVQPVVIVTDTPLPIVVESGSLGGGGVVGSGVSSLNSLQGDISLTGAGGSSVSQSGQTITITSISSHSSLSDLDFASSGHTGFASEEALVTTSGHLQVQIDSISGSGGVLTLNSLQGDVVISGGGGTSVSEFGQTITISSSDDHSLLTNLDFDSSGHTGFASEVALTTTSGHLQSQISSLGAEPKVNTVNSLEGDVVLSGSDLVSISQSGQTLIISGTSDHSSLSNLDFDSSGHTGFASEVALTTTSGHLQTQIDTFNSETYVNSLNSLTGNVSILGVGSVGVSESGQDVVISGSRDHSSFINLDFDSSGHIGFASEVGLTTTSGHLQTQIDSLDSEPKVNTLNSLEGDVLISGSGSVFALELGQTIVVSGSNDHSLLDNLDFDSSGHIGFASEVALVTTSGHLQNQIDGLSSGTAGVASINSLTGDVLVSGAGNNTVLGFGQTVIVSGSTDHSSLDNLDFDSSGHTGFASEVALTTTSGHLQTQIDNVSSEPKVNTLNSLVGNVIISGSGLVSASESGQTILLSGSTDHSLLDNLDFDSSGHTGFASEAALTTTSGHLQGQIDTVVAEPKVNTINLLEGNVTLSGSGLVSTSEVGQAVIISGSTDHSLLDNLDFDSSGHTGFASEQQLVTTSGHLQGQIDGLSSGSSGVTSLNSLLGAIVISGTGTNSVFESGQTIVVSGSTDHSSLSNLDFDSSGHIGFASEIGLTTTSGHLQGQIDVLTTEPKVNTLNSLEGDITVSGSDLISVSESGQNIIISGSSDHSALSNLDFDSSGHVGFASEVGLTTTSGHLQSQIDNLDAEPKVNTLNSLQGTVTLSGLGSVITSEAGQTITISGSTDHSTLDNLDFDSSGHIGFASEVSLTTTSGHLQSQINILDAEPKVNTLNSLEGNVTLSGIDSVSVSQSGQIILVSGSSSHSDLTNLDFDSSGHIGFASEVGLTTTSGHLQGQIDVLDSEPKVNTVNSLEGNVLISGSGLVSAITSGQIITLSGSTDHSSLSNLDFDSSGHIGFASEVALTTTSGHLQGQISVLEAEPKVNTVNSIEGDVTISGVGFVSTFESGQIVTVSGNTDHSLLDNLDFDSSGHTGFASEQQLVTTSGHLQNQIDGLSGGGGGGSTGDAYRKVLSGGNWIPGSISEQVVRDNAGNLLQVTLSNANGSADYMVGGTVEVGHSSGVWARYVLRIRSGTAGDTSDTLIYAASFQLYGNFGPTHFTIPPILITDPAANTIVSMTIEKTTGASTEGMTVFASSATRGPILDVRKVL